MLCTKTGFASFTKPGNNFSPLVPCPLKIRLAEPPNRIETQNDVEGWLKMKRKRALIDTDHDGMPDEWEKKNSLNPNNADDRNTVSNDGYTMLEKYKIQYKLKQEGTTE